MCSIMGSDGAPGTKDVFHALSLENAPIQGDVSDTKVSDIAASETRRISKLVVGEADMKEDIVESEPQI